MRTLEFDWGGDLELVRRALHETHDVISRTGVGGSASVFEAVRVRDGRNVALKVLHPSLLADARNVMRLEREARAAAMLDHANILRIDGLQQSNGLYWLEMPLLGPSLRAVTRDAPTQPPLNVVLHWLAHVCAAIAHAHERDVLHRDLNASNVLIDGAGAAVVTDFGIAWLSSEPALTDQGFTVGTAAYMSPERRAGAPASAAADLYAIGVLALELLTGRVRHAPLDGAADAQAALDRWRPTCPRGMRNGVIQLTAPDPADRPTDATEAARLLHARALSPADSARHWLRARAAGP